MGSIRGEFKEPKGLGGLFYLGRVCVNGTLESIRSVGKTNYSTLSSNETKNVMGRYAVLIIRNDSVYEVFRVRRDLTTESDLRRSGNKAREIDVKESDDILVFIFSICEEDDMNTTVCPLQVDVPAVDRSTLYYDGSDDIMTRNSNVFIMEVNNRVMMNSKISTNISLNVEVTINGNT